LIPLTKPYFDEKELQAVKEVFDSGWLAQGPRCEEFEEDVRKYLNVRYAITVSSCTSALYLALRALEIGEGDEVIVPSFTFPATALAVLWVGATPVFVDCCDDYTINFENVIRATNKKTRAIIPVHLFGNVCEIAPLIGWAKTNHLFIVEDAACALGAEYGNEKVGTLGDIGCFSLHAKKGITTGEGGIVVTNDFSLAERIRKESCFGIERTIRRNTAPSFETLGFNFKMSDIQAAIGIVQLRKLGEIIALREEVADTWQNIIWRDLYLSDRIRGVGGDVPFRNGHLAMVCKRKSYQSFVINTYSKDLDDKERREVAGYFQKKGFETGIGTYACHHHPVFLNYPKIGPLSYSDYFARNSISLPIYPGLNLREEWEKS